MPTCKPRLLCVRFPISLRRHIPEAIDMDNEALAEHFDRATLAPELRWYCEPAKWALDPANRVLRVFRGNSAHLRESSLFLASLI